MDPIIVNRLTGLLVASWRALPSGQWGNADAVLSDLATSRYQSGGPLSLLTNPAFVDDLAQDPTLLSTTTRLLGMDPVMVRDLAGWQDSGPTDLVPVTSHQITLPYARWRLESLYGTRRSDLSDLEDAMTHVDEILEVAIGFSEAEGRFTREELLFLRAAMGKDFLILAGVQGGEVDDRLLAPALAHRLGLITLIQPQLAEAAARNWGDPSHLIGRLLEIYQGKAPLYDRLNFHQPVDAPYFVVPPSAPVTPLDIDRLTLQSQLKGQRACFPQALQDPQPVDRALADRVVRACFTRMGAAIPGCTVRLKDAREILTDPRATDFLEAVAQALTAAGTDVAEAMQVLELDIPCTHVYFDSHYRAEFGDVLNKISRGFQRKFKLFERSDNRLVARFVSLRFEEACYQVLYGTDAVRYFFVGDHLDQPAGAGLDQDEVMTLKGKGFAPFQFVAGAMPLEDVGALIAEAMWYFHERYHGAMLASYSAAQRDWAQRHYQEVQGGMPDGDIKETLLSRLANMEYASTDPFEHVLGAFVRAGYLKKTSEVDPKKMGLFLHEVRTLTLDYFSLINKNPTDEPLARKVMDWFHTVNWMILEHSFWEVQETFPTAKERWTKMIQLIVSPGMPWAPLERSWLLQEAAKKSKFAAPVALAVAQQWLQQQGIM